MVKNDIRGAEDIKLFVDNFYQKVREDELLAPVFSSKIPTNQWANHLNRMYDFWNTVLFFQKSYKGNPFPKHANLPISKPHFSRWLTLFKASINEYFVGPKAEETKLRAEKIAALFISKIEYLKEHPNFKH